MTDTGTSPQRPPGRLATNLLHFVRLLRRAGLPLGPDRVIHAVQAVEAVGLEDRGDFYWALHAVLVRCHEHGELFDQAFRLFWRDPHGLEPVLDALLPKAEVPELEKPLPARRIREAVGPRQKRKGQTRRADRVELDAVLEYSPNEVVRTRDFEQMSASEVEQAKRMIADIRIAWPERLVRRYRPHMRGDRIYPRATLRATLRSGGSGIPLNWRRQAPKAPTIVALCDISGSMERYSRLLLHFLHALTNHSNRVHSFVFSTRLTNISRFLLNRDVDRALEGVGKAVTDWSGGTRIGACLRTFNVEWSRRVLSQGAIVLLITDGLDLDAGRGLALQAERLAKSSRLLVWLNPLLRFDEFEARAAGVKAILPYVDQFRPVHNVESLEGLARALARCTRGSSRTSAPAEQSTNRAPELFPDHPSE